MFCSKCGTNIADDAAFCPACGASTATQAAPAYQQQPTYQQPTYQQPTYQQPTYQQPTYQQPTYQQPAYQQPAYQQPAYQPDRFGGTPMKWYKFLIYFLLFAGAVVNVINAINCFTGAQYEGAADYLYAYYDGLQVMDIIMGLGCLALAAFNIYVRFRLAGLHRNGPQMLNYMYIAIIALNVVYSGVCMAIIGNFDATVLGSLVGNIIGNVVILAINTNYFGKRKHLFVN